MGSIAFSVGLHLADCSTRVLSGGFVSCHSPAVWQESSKLSPLHCALLALSYIPSLAALRCTFSSCLTPTVLWLFSFLITCAFLSWVIYVTSGRPVLAVFAGSGLSSGCGFVCFTLPWYHWKSPSQRLSSALFVFCFSLFAWFVLSLSCFLLCYLSSWVVWRGSFHGRNKSRWAEAVWVRWEMVKLWVTTGSFERENVDWMPREELLNITHYPVNGTIGDWKEAGTFEHERLCEKQACVSGWPRWLTRFLTLLILVIPRESDEGEGDKPEGLFSAGYKWWKMQHAQLLRNNQKLVLEKSYTAEG